MPRFLTTSRGGTPLVSNFLADAILLSIIFRLRPPLRPSWRATSSPALNVVLPELERTDRRPRL